MERRERKIAPLRQNLKQDQTNLELADRYWSTVGSGQSGRIVRDAYRGAALASSAGAATFARAYRDLCLRTGEGPRNVHFDEELIEALKTYLPLLTANDHSDVDWCSTLACQREF